MQPVEITLVSGGIFRTCTQRRFQLETQRRSGARESWLILCPKGRWVPLCDRVAVRED